MLKSMMDFVRYFLTYKNHLISSAFKFVFFSLFPGPPSPPETAPLDLPPSIYDY